jgi:hypothetical protein
MSLKRFGSSTDFASDSLIILENYGLTVYWAQLFERKLQNVITGLERLGEIILPPETVRFGDGFVDTCLGPMLRVLKTQAKMDREMSRLLEKAHYQRNLLVHRFMTDNIIDTLNEAGRTSINDKLEHIYNNVRRAEHVISQLADQVWAHLGVSPECVDQQVEELLRLKDNRSNEDPPE